MNYLLSVVIPTKNRQSYCLAAIKQILSLNFKNIEIIIQDNSDNSSLLDQIKLLNDSSIKYNYTSHELSFVDNFTLAVNLSSGEYVCVIGDDDGILNNIISVVEYAKLNNLDAVVPCLDAVYFWPMDIPIVKNAENGYLSVSDISRRSGLINPKFAIISLLKNGGQRYQQLNLPRLYHGIVKRDVLECIKQKTGTLFDGLTPDIYLAAALCFVAKKVVSISYPVTLSGICPRSGSSDSATGRHTGQLKDAPHFKGHDSYLWDSHVPAIYTVETIWAETVLHALNNFGHKELIKFFNIKLLDALCLYKYPQFSNDILKHAKNYGYTRFNLFFTYHSYRVTSFISRLKRKVLRGKNNLFRIYGITDISEAADKVVEILKLKQIM